MDAAVGPHGTRRWAGAVESPGALRPADHEPRPTNRRHRSSRLALGQVLPGSSNPLGQKLGEARRTLALPRACAGRAGAAARG